MNKNKKRGENIERQAASIMKKLGIRITSQRKAVLEVLIEEEGQHLSAEEIYTLLEERGQEVGLATIYRTLRLLEKKGLVACRTFAGDSACYEYIGRQEATHHHLICKECGKVIEISNLLVDNWREKLAAEKNFAATDCCIQIEGFCEDCQ